MHTSLLIHQKQLLNHWYKVRVPFYFLYSCMTHGVVYSSLLGKPTLWSGRWHYQPPTLHPVPSDETASGPPHADPWGFPSSLNSAPIFYYNISAMLTYPHNLFQIAVCDSLNDPICKYVHNWQTYTLTEYIFTSQEWNEDRLLHITQ
jgi:hypothetical protein